MFQVFNLPAFVNTSRSLIIPLLTIFFLNSGFPLIIIIPNDFVKHTTCDGSVRIFIGSPLIHLTTFVNSTRLFFLLKRLLNSFGDISGLQLNKEKTEAYWLGRLHDSPVDLGIEKVNKPMKSLGIFFSYDWHKCQELNFDKIIKSIKKSINAWQWRNLNLLGRIQIIKTFAIPKFMFRASQIP